ncbi:MAG: 30S ribosomal protein S4 [Puniceicoccales bacterium]|jgi:small subunit ribosomal protein S4|nr:30S ribosomal protein S4 [Puniceicoccales bacterium]
MRYIGPTTRINRRFKMAVFPLNKAYEKKPYLPGMHGARLKRRVSDYSLGLNEKQKLRFMFGLSEKQFHLTFLKAKNMRGITGEAFLRLLECRLDNVIYLLGFARTRRAARQLVGHGHVCVNGRKVNIASFSCSPGDMVAMSEKVSSRQLATRNLEDTHYRNCPAWLSVQPDAFNGVVNRHPTREEMLPEINEQLIVEYYSR